MSTPRENYEQRIRDTEDARDRRDTRRHYGDDEPGIREAHIRNLPPEVQAEILRGDEALKMGLPSHPIHGNDPKALAGFKDSIGIPSRHFDIHEQDAKEFLND